DLTGSLREAERLYAEKLGAARRSDALVRDRIDKNYAAIHALSMSLDEIGERIPVATPGPEHRAVMQRLKQALGRVAEVRAEMPALVERLKECRRSDDVGPLLATAMREKKEVSGRALFASQASRYDGVAADAEAWVKRQADAMDEVTKLNEEFAGWKSGNESARRREQAIQDLRAGHRNYKEVSAHLDDGMKFYSEFGAVVARFRQNCT
ncbi:pH-response regulator protein palA/rim20, partial [Cladochytrium tenue]